MQDIRIYSFDDSMLPDVILESDEDELEKELSSKIAARKDRELKEGFVFLKQPTWLSTCCGLFSEAWQRRYARAASDRLVLSLTEESSEVSSIYLKGATVAITNIMGHDGKHNSLSIVRNNKEVLLSLSSSEELRYWLLAITFLIESLDKKSTYFNF
jgi:hypothetical protein